MASTFSVMLSGPRSRRRGRSACTTRRTAEWSFAKVNLQFPSYLREDGTHEVDIGCAVLDSFSDGFSNLQGRIAKSAPLARFSRTKECLAFFCSGAGWAGVAVIVRMLYERGARRQPGSSEAKTTKEESARRTTRTSISPVVLARLRIASSPTTTTCLYASCYSCDCSRKHAALRLHCASRARRLWLRNGQAGCARGRPARMRESRSARQVLMSY